MLKIETDTAASVANPVSVMDAIYRRRAVRSYTPDIVERAAVRTLLDAAVQAPTAVHEEPWAFAVIQDRGTLRLLSDNVKESLHELEHGLHLPGDGGGGRFALPENVFYDAGTLIVIYGKPLGPFVTADCWLAAQNLMLAACAIGLGSCVIGLAVGTLNTPAWKKELKIPAELTAYAPIIIGVPAAVPPATGRREPEVLLWKRGLTI